MRERLSAVRAVPSFAKGPPWSPALPALVRDHLARRAHAHPRRRPAAGDQAARTCRRSRKRRSGSCSTWRSRSIFAGLMLRARRRRARRAVPRRLAHRVQPLDRQPVRLRHHHGPLRGAAEDPAGGADGGHHHRARAARASSSCWARPHRELQLDLLHLRRLPALHGVQPGVRQPRGRRRGERPHPDAAQAHRHRRPTSTASSCAPSSTARGSSRRCSSSSSPSARPT